MRPDDANRIRHMIEAAEAAQQFIAGRQRDDLDAERMLLFALVRAVEVLGEPASKVSAETRAETASIPWPAIIAIIAIIAMRNRPIHAYFDVDPDILWKTVTEEIPVLRERLLSICPKDR